MIISWKRLAIPCAAATTTALLGLTGAPALATVPPKDVGWLYLDDGAGKAYFDADLAGYPSWERITVCDTKSNGLGVEVAAWGDLGQFAEVRDPSNDGSCTTLSGNLFPDGYGVLINVEQYAGDQLYDWKSGQGVA